MNDMEDAAKERKQTQRPWLILLGIVVILLGSFVFVLFKDAPPPDDRWILPHAKISFADNDNPLGRFCEFVKDHPADGYLKLFSDAKGDIKQIKIPELEKFLAHNSPQAEAFDRLMESAASTWNWPDMDEHVSAATPFNYLSECQSTPTQIQRIRVELKSREGKVPEAADNALQKIRFGRRLGEIPGCLIHYLVAQSSRRQGEMILEAALTGAEVREDTLQQIQETLMQSDPAPRQMGDALRWDYLFGKNSVNDPRALVSWASGKTDQFLIEHFSQLNRTAAMQLEMERPLIEAADRDWPDLIHAKMMLERRLEKWSDQLVFLLSPNVGGHLALQNTFEQYLRVLGFAVNDCALHRQALLVVALRRFELQHGKLPQNLEELCPEFLPSVPLDPFDGAPMRWDPVKMAIYSVGANLADDHGSFGTPWKKTDKDVGMLYWWKPRDTKTKPFIPVPARRRP